MPNLRVSRVASRPIASRAQIRAQIWLLTGGIIVVAIASVSVLARPLRGWARSPSCWVSWWAGLARCGGVAVTVAVTAPVSRPGVRLLCRVRQHWQGPGL